MPLVRRLTLLPLPIWETLELSGDSLKTGVIIRIRTPLSPPRPDRLGCKQSDASRLPSIASGHKRGGKQVECSEIPIYRGRERGTPDKLGCKYLWLGLP